MIVHTHTIDRAQRRLTRLLLCVCVQGINSIPHFNVALSVEPGDNVLLKGDKRRGMPAITLDDWEHSGGDDNAQRAGGDNTLFVMDE